MKAGLLLLLTALVLAMPAAALAKGPSAASIDGPGTGGGIDIEGSLAPGSPLAELSERAGFYSAVFRQTPDLMRDSRPPGDLGPKYTITYTVPGPEGETFVLHQDVYPYATPKPVTYMVRGQKVFRIETRGGWFVAGSRLKDVLVSAGLPEVAPSGSSSNDGALSSAELLGALAAATLLLGAAAVILVRRRERPAAAA
jgi:hypothetical protein